jgi:hypothetical protein
MEFLHYVATSKQCHFRVLVLKAAEQRGQSYAGTW